MSNTGSAQLYGQGRDVAAMFYQDGIDLYGVPARWRNSKALVEERITYSTQNATNTYGNKTVFKLDQRCHLDKEWYLQFGRTAGVHPVTTTNPNTPHSAVDYEGIYSIDKVEVIYLNKSVWSKTGEQMLDDLPILYNDRQRAGIAEQTNGMLSLVERQKRFALAQTFKVPLQCPWRLPHKALPRISLPGDVTVEITWRAANSIFRQPHTTSGTLPTLSASCSLITDSVHLLDADAKALQNAVFGSKIGYAIKIVAQEYQARYSLTSLSAGTANADVATTVKLPNLKNLAYMVRFKLRYQDLVDGNSKAVNDPHLLLPIRSVQLVDQSKEVVQVQSYINNHSNNISAPSLALYTDNVTRFPYAPVGSPLYILSLCPNQCVADCENNCYTGRQFNKYSNPEAIVTWNTSLITTSPVPLESDLQYPATSASKAAIYIDIYTYCHQVLIQAQGDFKKYINI